MSLNTAIISGRDPVNGQPMIDPIGYESPLPLDVSPIIFQNLRSDLPSVALVCKNWKALADNKLFRKMIRPCQAFGTKEWMEYIGVDAGEELPLPRRAYGDLEKGGHLLTFIPDIVKITKENGVTEEVSLDHLDVIVELVGNPKMGNKTGYSPSCPPQAANKEKIKVEKPHWVWIKKEVIGKNESYKQQKVLAKACGAKISGLIDTVISVFMEYVRSGEWNFIFDPSKNEHTLVRVNESVNGCRLVLRVEPSGLYVGTCYDYANVWTGFAPAQKSFETFKQHEISTFQPTVWSVSQYLWRFFNT